MQLDTFKAKLMDYLIENFEVEEGDIDDDTPLFSSSLLDSFGMIDLVAFIEKEASVKFETLDLHMDNVDSIDQIMAFVAKKKSQA